jgi:hypothetical protein
MRPDLIEEEYLENERRRSNVRPPNFAPRMPDKSAERTPIRQEQDNYFNRSADFPENNNDFGLVSADEEWVCERCGAEIPPAGRFCAACGYATGYSNKRRVFANVGTQIKGWYAGINDLATRYGLGPASQIAIAVAAFFIGGAIIVQLSIPSASPWFSQAELYQTYAMRTLLWLLGSVVALMMAIVFKRQSRPYDKF